MCSHAYLQILACVTPLPAQITPRHVNRANNSPTFADHRSSMPSPRCCYCGKDIPPLHYHPLASVEVLTHAAGYRVANGKPPLTRAHHLCRTHWRRPPVSPATPTKAKNANTFASTNDVSTMDTTV